MFQDEKSEPGKYAVDAEAECAVLLSAKLNILVDFDSEGEPLPVKRVARGVMKKNFENWSALRYQTFMDALHLQNENRSKTVDSGIRYKGGHAYTYRTLKQSVSGYYIKRYVNDDHCSTSTHKY